MKVEKTGPPKALAIQALDDSPGSEVVVAVVAFQVSPGRRKGSREKRSYLSNPFFSESFMPRVHLHPATR